MYTHIGGMVLILLNQGFPVWDDCCVASAWLCLVLCEKPINNHKTNHHKIP